MRLICALLTGWMLSSPMLAGAVSMTNDPKGFRNIVWGTALNTRTDLEPTRQGPNIIDYRFKNAPPTFADIPVESLQLSTVDDQFARVTVRYHGKDAHDQLLAFLQSRYGAIDRTPGQFTGGAVKIFAWQGDETAVSLRYDTRTDRGIIFFENPSLASRLEGAMAPDQDLGGATY